jgi:hypothetical protein
MIESYGEHVLIHPIEKEEGNLKLPQVLFW